MTHYPFPGLAETFSPSGLQPLQKLKARRIVVGALCAVTYFCLSLLLALVLGSGGWTWIDVVLMFCFMITSPWSVLGFWNSIIGIWLCHISRGGLEHAAPFALHHGDVSLIKQKTAIVMTVRNEDTRRWAVRLSTVIDSVEKEHSPGDFSYFILSDTSDAEIAAQEEIAVSRLREIHALASGRIHYRRRVDNSGFKAGNLRDFCIHLGREFECMIPLDADSLMTGATIVKMEAMMEASPGIGIVQSLVVGMPAASPFARVFQFGMRHGMRTYTMGSTWWAGDCGQFWGHNAIIRIAPFLMHCQLPVLSGTGPLSGPILSHDQVEAAFMRKAGFEVRVLPVETGSYEDNPPDISEFLRRDSRWCHGNLQYYRLLFSPGLRMTSRFQLFWAIMMYIGIPAGTLIVALVALKPMAPKSYENFPVSIAILVYVLVLVMNIAPKLAGFVDVALKHGEIARYGGYARFIFGCCIELVFSFFLGAVATFQTSLFMIGLFSGRSVRWASQLRDARSMTFSVSCREFWPQTLFGLGVAALLYRNDTQLLLWSLPLIAGNVIAIPFALITSNLQIGRFMKRERLCGIPEEFHEVREIAALTRVQKDLL